MDERKKKFNRILTLLILITQLSYFHRHLKERKSREFQLHNFAKNFLILMFQNIFVVKTILTLYLLLYFLSLCVFFNKYFCYINMILSRAMLNELLIKLK